MDQPLPSASSRVLPVKASHPWLKKVQSLSGPEIQIMTGAVSAMLRNRFSLSCSAASVCRRSVMSSTRAMEHVGSPLSSRTSDSCNLIQMIAPSLRTDCDLHAIRCNLAREEAAPVRKHSRAVVRMHRVHQPSSQRALRAGSRDTSQYRSFTMVIAPSRVTCACAHGGLVEDRAETFFAGSQCRLRPLALAQRCRLPECQPPARFPVRYSSKPPTGHAPRPPSDRTWPTRFPGRSRSTSPW